MALRSDFRIAAKTPAAPETRKPENLAVGVAEVEQAVLGYTTPLPELNGVLRGEAAAPAQPPAPASPEPAARRVAVLVTHGMGQQVPFETLSAIGQALITEHSRGKPKSLNCTVNVRRVRLTCAHDAPQISRAELCLHDHNGTPVDVHVYESYWAPMTEGQISFLETVAFLYSSAWNGLKMCWSKGYTDRRGRYFDRWIFGDFQQMRIKSGTLFTLLTMLFAISLMLIPALLLFTPLGVTAGNWLLDMYKDLFFTWKPLLQGITLLALIAFGVIAYWIHYFTVEFAGDVAIYVSSYKVSRFDSIRNSILKEACAISRQIYSAGILDDREKPYDSVVIVGHSLGSVVSYDTLNSAINWDQVECAFKYRVVERTTRLITFGSPLDKTAFLFRTQVSSARNLREALAARQQPLVLDYQQFRPPSFKWINIYSPMDIVSGRLDYYDLRGKAALNPVENRIDRKARTPIIAHTQYWNNEELHKTLYEAVWAQAPVPRA